MSEPRTESGRKMLEVIYRMDDPQGLYPPDPADLVAAIEAEAATQQADAKDSPWWRWSERDSETRGETS